MADYIVRLQLNDSRLSRRFWDKVRLEVASGCWLWTACTDKDGYGRYSEHRKTKRAHRVSYEALIGPIAPGLCIDHLCRVSGCVNPLHLEPVTIRENVLRGDSPGMLGAMHRAKTHCPAGHPYDALNTYVRPNLAGRTCKTCTREGWRTRYNKETESLRKKDYYIRNKSRIGMRNRSWKLRVNEGLPTVKSSHYVVYTDGSITGGWGIGGWVIFDRDGNQLNRGVEDLGTDTTSNRAEYAGVRGSLLWLGERYFAATVIVMSDSQLIVNQLSGAWSCNDVALRQFKDEINSIISTNELSVTFNWIPRTENTAADLVSRRPYFLKKGEAKLAKYLQKVDAACVETAVVVRQLFEKS